MGSQQDVENADLDVIADPDVISRQNKKLYRCRYNHQDDHTNVVLVMNTNAARPGSSTNNHMKANDHISCETVACKTCNLFYSCH